ncbi:hypothetical protein DLJ53_27570 [Acuticoccus sediminis]|uniref:HK97 gp10 family phage protein n=1 Tax=Acuticoccus sediminis TaxID=2184697 RepID=A0A8B2NMJ5_9HYPH|nr:HK97-gp10 family putative phage morphogenesis protein [Acuticoccus sediminis]RAH97617.1 hypothetical protein DLJ53_27570 [Acuticoccus sediminis]
MGRVKGLDKAQRKLKTLSKSALEAVQPALIKGAEDIANIQRSLAPEDEGDLRDSIHVTKPGEATPYGAIRKGEATVAEPNQAIITAYSDDVDYAYHVEFGTSDTDAQPFFAPGYRLGKKKALNRIKRAIATAVKREAQ